MANDETKDQDQQPSAPPAERRVRLLSKVQVARTNARNKQTEIVTYPAGKRLPASTFTASELDELSEMKAIEELDVEPEE